MRTGPFVTSGLPLLLGMAVTFAAVATLAAVGGGWTVDANHYGRLFAIILLALFGITLLFPGIGRPGDTPAGRPRFSPLAIGGSWRRRWFTPSARPFSWALRPASSGRPAPGPILGLVLTGAALEGASARTSLLLLLAYAAGAATLACRLPFSSAAACSLR